MRTASDEKRTAVPLPRRLRNSRNLAPQRQSPETQPTNAELPEKSPRTPANLAAVVLTRRKLRLLCVLNSFCCCSHLASSSWLLASSNLFCCESCGFTSAIRPLTSDLSRPKRHSQMLQQTPRLVIRSRRRHDRHIHALQLVNLRVIDLRKNQLIVQAERIVAAPVERLGRNSTKITHTRQNNRYQAIEKFIHAIAAQRNHRPDRHAFANFKGGNRLLCLGDDRLLPCNLAQFVRRRIHDIGVLCRLSHAHVDDNLVQPRNRHRILQVKFLGQRHRNFFFKACAQPRPFLG